MQQEAVDAVGAVGASPMPLFWAGAPHLLIAYSCPLLATTPLTIALGQWESPAGGLQLPPRQAAHSQPLTESGHKGSAFSLYRDRDRLLGSSRSWA